MNKIRENMIRRYAWIVLLLAAIVLVGVSLYARRGTDYTETAARKISEVIARRMAVLDTYTARALAQPHDQWMDLEGLPEDMVVYRYVADSLQSWCHQFTVDNDDISARMVIQRFPDLRYNLVSPLSQVVTLVSLQNIGPKWYLTYSRTGDDGCRVIAGL